MQKKSSCAALAALLVFPLAVLAQGTPVASPGVDQRQANQEKRIRQGGASGQLTAKESARLERGQERIEKKEERAKADGKVTPKERAQLRRAQDRQSAQIYQQKHDRQRDLNHDGRADQRKARP